MGGYRPSAIALRGKGSILLWRSRGLLLWALGDAARLLNVPAAGCHGRLLRGFGVRTLGGPLRRSFLGLARPMAWSLALGLVVAACHRTLPNGQRDGMSGSAHYPFLREIIPANAPRTARTIDVFRRITHDMTMKQVIELCGVPDADVGAGIFILLYQLGDGSQVRGASTADRERLWYVQHASRENTYYLLRND